MLFRRWCRQVWTVRFCKKAQTDIYGQTVRSIMEFAIWLNPPLLPSYIPVELLVLYIFDTNPLRRKVSKTYGITNKIGTPFLTTCFKLLRPVPRERNSQGYVPSSIMNHLDGKVSSHIRCSGQDRRIRCVSPSKDRDEISGFHFLMP